MLNNRNFNIVLAIVIAISLWAYVLGDVNPTISITVKDVPIEYVNEDILENSGLVILESSEKTVNVTISGPRTEVTKVKQSDFKVTADVDALGYGNNTVRLVVSGPNKVEITHVSTDKINVVVDKLVTEERDVVVVAAGEFAENEEPYVVEQSKETIKVTGAKTLVEKVKQINAVLESSKITNNLNTVSASLQAVDSEGNVVEGVILESKSINVSAIMHHTKTVHLEVPIENQDADGYERSVSVPKTVVIKGEDDVLSEIDKVVCKAIDLSLYTESTQVQIVPILPDGVQLSTESADVCADIVVKALGKITVKFDGDDIKLINTSENFEYEISTKNLTLEVSGKTADIADLTAEDFKITADVDGLKAGTHIVKIEVEGGETLASVKPSTDEIEIVIK